MTVGNKVILECATEDLPPVVRRAMLASGIRETLVEPRADTDDAVVPFSGVAPSAAIFGAWKLGELASAGQLAGAPRPFRKRASAFALLCRSLAARDPDQLTRVVAPIVAQAERLLEEAERIWPEEPAGP